jgi:hypothetical protein
MTAIMMINGTFADWTIAGIIPKSVMPHMEPHGQRPGPLSNAHVGRHPGHKMSHGSLTPYGGASRQGSVSPSCALYPKGKFRPSTARGRGLLLPGSINPTTNPFSKESTSVFPFFKRRC